MADAKKALRELVQRDNNACADCSNPNPQWASVSFAVFLCLQCAGVHRGFGVHISFVRSVSMDTWQLDQLKRMQLGGNTPFKLFLKSYSPPDLGGYSDGMDPHALYHSWAATQYREKLDYTLAGKSWSPSIPPPRHLSPAPVPSRPSSAQGLRKSRTSARSPPTSHAASTTPSPPHSQTSHSLQKSANEAYFTSLGQMNAARPTDLPPSQGGRYQGFGNTPPPSSQNPSFNFTSVAAPSLADLQDNPAAALGKSWSLFSAVVAGASRVVNDHVIQPGMERVMDPSLHASVRGYVSEAQKRAQLAGQSVNEWSKVQLGVDLVGAAKGADPSASGYGVLPAHDDGETSALYDDTSDLFHEYSDSPPTSTTSKPAAATHASHSSCSEKTDDWDEWQDF